MIFSNRDKYILILSLLLTGCLTTYNQKITPVREEVKSVNYKKAIALFNKTGLDKQNRNNLLYHFEAGLLYHLAGEYEKSNRFLENSEWISDELYTKSISQEAATLITSNKILPYRGDIYEYLFVNYYKLLNYLYLGNLEDALVEVRRINHKLSLFNKNDAFLHYITAILYQCNLQDSDAFIEYKKAYDAYSKKYPEYYGVKIPEQLKKDIAVFWHESKFSRCKEFPSKIINSYKPPEKYGSVVFIVETGFIPNKTEVTMNATIPQEYKKKHPEKLKDAYYLTISLPAYEPVIDQIEQVNLNLSGKVYEMNLVEDLGAIARKTLEDKKTKIIAKAIARAVAKYITYKSVKGKKTDNENKNFIKSLLGASVNILGVATEGADTRSWLMLPDRVFLSHHYLEPGEYAFNMDITSLKGIKKNVKKETFTIKKGENKFIILRQ